jgi:peptidoglycan/xylan/chitin deacetylase (PgdA/CDA1 family)
MDEVKLFKSFEAQKSTAEYSRHMLRKLTLKSMSLTCDIHNSNDWVRFPYYHHVFDDEKIDFERQLKYLKNFGDFISLTEACAMLKESSKINGRYFCVSFDDGFANCASNMAEVSVSLEVPVMIYIPTKFIGFKPTSENIQELEVFKNKGNPPVRFLDWKECKELLEHNVEFGSHTVNHVALTGLSVNELENELENSKKVIEDNLGVECLHFACPWGRPNIDFDILNIAGQMKSAGYQSFATTQRGKMDKEFDYLFNIKRDHLLASWENYQLKYFFSR